MVNKSVLLCSLMLLSGALYSMNSTENPASLFIIEAAKKQDIVNSGTDFSSQYNAELATVVASNDTSTIESLLKTENIGALHKMVDSGTDISGPYNAALATAVTSNDTQTIELLLNIGTSIFNQFVFCNACERALCQAITDDNSKGFLSLLHSTAKGLYNDYHQALSTAIELKRFGFALELIKLNGYSIDTNVMINALRDNNWDGILFLIKNGAHYSKLQQTDLLKKTITNDRLDIAAALVEKYGKTIDSDGDALLLTHDHDKSLWLLEHCTYKDYSYIAKSERAAQEKDSDLVKILVEKYRAPASARLLYIAIDKDDDSLSTWLCTQKADVNSALCNALENKKWKVAQCLLEHGADKNTALAWVATTQYYYSSDRPSTMQWLVDKGAQIKSLDQLSIQSDLNSDAAAYLSTQLGWRFRLNRLWFGDEFSAARSVAGLSAVICAGIALCFWK